MKRFGSESPVARAGRLDDGLGYALCDSKNCNCSTFLRGVNRMAKVPIFTGKSAGLHSFHGTARRTIYGSGTGPEQVPLR